MPKIRPVGFASLAFHHLGANVTGEMVNTLDVDFTGLGRDWQGSDTDEVSQLWASGPHARHSGAILYTKLTVMAHQPGGALEAFESTTGTITGSGGSDVMPLSVAAIVQKTTGLAGRPFRGRWFFGGISLDAAKTGDPNTLDSAWTTPMQTACTQFRIDLLLADLDPVLLHEGAHPPTSITSFDVHGLVGTMRKRIR